MAETKIEISEIKKRTGWQKLAKVQADISVAKERDGANSRYKYYTTEDILSAAKRQLAEVGAAVTMTDEIEEHNGKLFIKCTARFIDADTDKVVAESIGIVEHALNPGMNAAQSTGTTSTYARKRALAGLLLVDGERDPDEIGAEPKGKQPQRAQQQQAPIKLTLRERLLSAGIDPEDFATVGCKTSFAEISPQDATRFLQNLESFINQYKERKAKAPK